MPQLKQIFMRSQDAHGIVVLLHRYECTLKDSTGAVCGRLVEARERAGHRLVCQHRPAQCTHEGCGKTLAKVDLAFHLEECGFRQQACDFCEKVGGSRMRLPSTTAS